MKFKLEIELGNDAMQTGRDVANALRSAAERIDDVVSTDPADMTTVVMDTNGNTVGQTWTEED